MLEGGSPRFLGAVAASLATAHRTTPNIKDLRIPSATDLAEWQREPQEQELMPFVWKLAGATWRLRDTAKIFSPIFKFKGYKWRMYVEPGDHVGVFLFLCDVARTGPAAAQFTLTCCNQVYASAWHPLAELSQSNTCRSAGWQGCCYQT